MKRCARIMALMCAMLLLLSAFAREQNALVCDCDQTPCVCFVQMGDRGLAVRGAILRLKEKTYLPEKHKVDTFDEAMREAVCAFQKDWAIPETGTLDDITFTLLLFDQTPLELDPDGTQTDSLMVWVPTDGGKRRHAKFDCCDMQDPRKVSVRSAEMLGMLPCGKCHPY